MEEQKRRVNAGHAAETKRAIATAKEAMQAQAYHSAKLQFQRARISARNLPPGFYQDYGPSIRLGLAVCAFSDLDPSLAGHRLSQVLNSPSTADCDPLELLYAHILIEHDFLNTISFEDALCQRSLRHCLFWTTHSHHLIKPSS
jgi:hypothetical protein